MTSTRPQHFGFTKLLVTDLEASAAFYSTVCELQELARVESKIGGRAIREIMYQPTAEGAGMFVLLQFVDQAAPGGDEVILGFQTEDVEAFVKRALAAGASLVEPVKDMPEHGVRVGFIADNEGHLIEVVELLEPAA